MVKNTTKVNKKIEKDQKKLRFIAVCGLMSAFLLCSCRTGTKRAWIQKLSFLTFWYCTNLLSLTLLRYIQSADFMKVYFHKISTLNISNGNLQLPLTNC